jgi:hypothetical protein
MPGTPLVTTSGTTTGSTGCGMRQEFCAGAPKRWWDEGQQRPLCRLLRARCLRGDQAHADAGGGASCLCRRPLCYLNVAPSYTRQWRSRRTNARTDCPLCPRRHAKLGRTGAPLEIISYLMTRCCVSRHWSSTCLRVKTLLSRVRSDYSPAGCSVGSAAVTSAPCPLSKRRT